MDDLKKEVLHLLAPLMIGTALHLLVLYKRGKSNGLFGWISLGAISVFTGLLFRYVGVAYYKYNNAEIEPEIVDFLLVMGSTIGFGGFMFVISKFDDFWTKLLDHFLGGKPHYDDGYPDYVHKKHTTNKDIDYFDR